MPLSRTLSAAANSFSQQAFVSRDASDLNISIHAITTLKKRYGNTITTTLWRYVEQSEQPMKSWHLERRSLRITVDTVSLRTFLSAAFKNAR
jgi:hypothetical protein